MSLHASCRSRSRRPLRRGMSLIELLVILSIIILIVALVMPALGRAREEGRIAYCMANLHSIAQATAMYVDNEEEQVIPWYTYPAHAGYSPQVYTPYVFGGFTARREVNQQGQRPDASLYPIEIRQLNPYIAPGKSGKWDTVGVYICKSDPDRNPSYGSGTTTPGQGGNPFTSWQQHGTSYSLNPRFMEGYAGGAGPWQLGDVGKHARRIAPHMIGGKAARFIVWSEQGFYIATAGATPRGSSNPLHPGWHGEFSNWAAAFADGHVEYRYYDTRFTQGDGWTIWEPR